VRMEGLSKLKNSMTSSGIESATFRLVAYCFDQLRYRVSPVMHMIGINFVLYDDGRAAL
jgi:hypothetical protein